ncbi:MAG: hypothetical protein UY72_C0061G0007 [Candidatus Uhrbacteria bacterium GW2011_GWD2_52_7]|uniref:Uncharacterized protein n=1 Tax=Candidatus Uhrbacteria bacterium GW2011_GWD2_52_7 TaxID=1618989 RepID=A0A0G1ZL81_9BACT|nr:MAG: hypothetical protein UY72_C0061G0007 [Candidatus Uhrbacteria bacterium GW2011_GWD2_52_7]
MVKTLIRFGMSVALGLALALPFVHLSPVLPAQAATLEADDILSEDFGDTTGLGQADLKTAIGQLINVALGFLGVVAVVIILMGGFKWMTAGGNDKNVEEAKRLIIAGIIGLAIILAAYAIASFVISSILSATQE